LNLLKTYKLVFLILIFLTSFEVWAQNSESIISGFISDSTSGEVLIGSNILVYKDSINTNQSPFRGTSTNNYGFYALPKLRPGLYYIVVRNLGYKTQIKEIQISSQLERIQIDFKLVSENIKLQEVVVEGKKLSEPISSSIDIDPEIFKKLPSMSATNDVFRVLQSLPGIKVASDISSGLYVRGGSPDQNLTLVDGVMVYNPTHLGNFSGVFNTDAIQNIRLIKGAFPAEYGGRLSSVLDIMLRSGTKEKGRGKLSLGTINSALMFEGPLNQNVTYMISGEKMYYDFIQNEFLKSDLVPRYNFYNLNTKITFTPSTSDIYSLSGLYSQDNLYAPTNSDGIDYNINWKNAFASISWQHINSKSSFIVTTLSYIDYEFQSILEDKSSSQSANNYYSLSDLKDLSANINAEIYWNPQNTLKIGTELVFHDYALIYSNFYDPLIEQTYQSLPDIFSLEGALYIQDESSISDWLKTNLGLRGYYFKSKKYFSIEPRLSAEIIASENLSFTAAYAVAHQFLHLIIRNDISLPTDLWYPSSDKIEPSKSSQYVLGVNYNINNKKYVFSVEGYYKDMKNLYEFKNSNDFNIGDPIEILFTQGQGEAYGIEFFAYKTAGNLSGWIGYTLSWTRRKFDDLNAGKIYYPRYDRRHDISLTLAYEINDSWSVGVNWVYASGQGFTVPTGQYMFESIGVNTQTNLQYNYTERNGYTLSPYHKLDLNVTYKFDWGNLGVETYLNLYNVYNRNNPFAIYSTNDYTEVNNETTALPVSRINEISLFPFIPSVGITLKF
jgi:hypothetical protein